ncbi:MAG: hypothetical protein E6899_06920 [Neisseria sp.]|nr:hypothetical protein [Neisseria sp.]
MLQSRARFSDDPTPCRIIPFNQYSCRIILFDGKGRLKTLHSFRRRLSYHHKDIP